MKKVYLDNAATTPVSESVIKEITDKLSNYYGNASTLYEIGRSSKSILEDVRIKLANSINAKENEIIFTSGGTESDNSAIIKTAETRQNYGKHIITTKIEHEAVLKPMKYLENHGYEVSYLDVDSNGNISIEDLKNNLREDTILVSIMMGNNEVGVQNPIHEIGELLKDHQAYFHTDAVQAYGLKDIDVNRDNIDLLSTSAHKINGPKMTGFLFKRETIKLNSFVLGGDQEQKRRAGTENIPSIAGFGVAVNSLTKDEKEKRITKYNSFREKILTELNNNNIEYEINGPKTEPRLEHILNIWIKGIPTDLLQMNLDLDGVAIAGGSACTAGSLEPSHVLSAMFPTNPNRVNESIRISFGSFTSEDDIDLFIERIVKVYNRLNKNRRD
ncbi:aminotransferase class V-fold PLP-dependent enzyme [Lactobacillus sp. S2-2]|uniref:cysteine desulfurase family protein n=1 Tax=Lactobacillus sp. S2-2 TaxID=2692917 RepID=UPI001F33DD4D|nr:cysteine desulfurase family protein [Lactobacillus sp. S2-2]MCF6514868.1 aminotransferase class V-fold PLP-dependent enzyme [Lactobacillus sp. S2-2]